jgi:hypothetical protein
MDIFEVGLRHPLRSAVEDHIRDIYARSYDARIHLFAPRLFAAVDGSGRIRCAAGIRMSPEPFHCACYLDRPAEQVVAAALARPVHGSELMEFTTLACCRPGEALGFVSRLVQQGREQGCHIALFTGTAPLRHLLSRAGLAVIPIAVADRQRVANPLDWGRYFDTDPLVCVAPDSATVPVLLRGPCFASARRSGMAMLPAPQHA